MIKLRLHTNGRPL